MEPYTTGEIIRDLAELEVGRRFDLQGNIVTDEEASAIGAEVGFRFLGWLTTLKVRGTDG